MKVLVIGAAGKLGSELVRTLPHNVIPLTHSDIEITNSDSVHAAIGTHRPKAVINTAAFHKPVDLCESEALTAFSVNALGARNLAFSCWIYGVDLIHISTDYVFGADKARRSPYYEEDRPGPVNMYGLTKLAGEQLIQTTTPWHFIVRTSGLYGGKGDDFVRLMLRKAASGDAIRVVNDQRLTPTYVSDLASQINLLIGKNSYGTYHATNDSSCTWYEFASAIFDIASVSPELERAKTGDFSEAATRPVYSVLHNKKLRRLGLDCMRHWREALGAFLTNE